MWLQDSERKSWLSADCTILLIQQKPFVKLAIMQS